MKRMLLAPMLLVAAAVAFSACGSAATGTTSSVVNLESTNYHTLPPTLTTLLPPTTLPNGASTLPGATLPPGSVTTSVTEYKVQSGDYPSKVAKMFSITTSALDQANTDTAGYGSFYVGLTIKIPAGAVIPTTTVAPTSSLVDLTKGTVKPGQCVRGYYTIQKGDLPTTVAKKFSITRAQLDAANVNTKGYTNFIVGSKIIIPAATGCKG